MNPSSFEHIVRIQFNALMMTVIKCTVKNRNRQFARRSKREVLFCKLSNKERDVILLRYFQSMSDQEIAELYHVSRSAIYRRRSNGLKKLKTVLKERN